MQIAILQKVKKMTNAPHLPVLLTQVLNSFSDCESGYIVDCTLGYAGHSSAILDKLPKISLVGIDRDNEALDYSSKVLKKFGDRAKFKKGTFAQILPTIKENPIVGVLADFGVSSLQLDKMDRGFSFESDNLDMRMDRDANLTAYEVINSYTQERLEYIFKHYGEIPRARLLADEVIRIRNKQPIKSGKELSSIARSILPSGGKIHPATLMFQAIRIEVNDELGQIEGLLDTLQEMKPTGTIVSLITFHSLEDRLVKNRFKQWSRECICPPDAMRCTCGKNHALGKIITKKPIIADKEELETNPRSRSAKLRSFLFKGE
jgi:16S rRNA (cytosine1402-N4)-methyltransferase